jgi:hypothetical protein
MVDAGGTLRLAAVGPASPLAGQTKGSLGPAHDAGDPPLGGESALGVEFHNGPTAERLDLLGPP